MSFSNLIKSYTKINFEVFSSWIKKISKYLIARAVGVAVYMGTLILFVEIFKLNPVISTVIANILTSVYLYFTSYIWVFKYKGSHAYSLPRFIFIEILTLFMNTGVMYLTVEILGLDYLYGVVIGVILIPLTNFLLNFLWAFKN
jgi:putative flippase GtrA